MNFLILNLKNLLDCQQLYPKNLPFINKVKITNLNSHNLIMN